jgi:hypothetical protein
MAAVLLWGTPLYPGAGAPFYFRILNKRELDFTHPLGFEGAVGSAP